MSYLIGFGLAIGTVLIALWIGFERRTFYATVVILVATYYVLFAVMAGASRAIVIESSVTALFVALAAAGYRRNMWLLVAGLAGHGLFDMTHALWVTNPGVPEYWPAFCATYDVVAALALAWLVVRTPRGVDATRQPLPA